MGPRDFGTMLFRVGGTQLPGPGGTYQDQTGQNLCKPRLGKKTRLVGFRPFGVFEVSWEKEIYKWPELFFFNINVCFLRFFLGVKFSPWEWKIRDPGLTWHEISMWGEVSLLEGGAQLATSRWMDSPKVLFFWKLILNLNLCIGTHIRLHKEQDGFGAESHGNWMGNDC